MTAEPSYELSRPLTLTFDAARSDVLLCVGVIVVTKMSIGEYKQTFGLEAVRALLSARVGVAR